MVVAYPSGTNLEQWLSERIKAIDARIEFIQTRTVGLIDVLRATNADAVIALE